MFVLAADKVWSDWRLMGSGEKSGNGSDVPPVKGDSFVVLRLLSAD